MTGNGKNNPHLSDFAKALLGWDDERIVSKDDISVWYRFLEYLVNLAEDDGWQYDGHSLKEGTPMSMLVVRATIENVPHVVFTSARTTTGCMRSFLRKMEEGFLEWREDKFRG